MKLRVKDRILLSMILPQEGSLATMRTIRKVREALEFTPDESAALKFVVDGKQTTWDPGADNETDVSFEAEGFKLLVKQFENLDQEGKLTLDHLAVYERFLAVISNA